MSALVILDNVELIPVLELVPMKFAKETRTSPSDSDAGEWRRYWTDSLSDSGLSGLRPIRPGSWHVATTGFSEPATILKYLGVIFEEWGGIETLDEPDCKPVLNGGLALRCPPRELLIEPTCCADLGNSADWRNVAGYRKSEWEMLWIGHPWISAKFENPWLILSEPHESESPIPRWAVNPDALGVAYELAELELVRFAVRLAEVLPTLGFVGDACGMGRKLAGLTT